MSTTKDSPLYRNPADTDLKFFSAVTASVTHELNNVLSIINQTGGLLEDLLYGVSQGETIQPEQLERIAGKINVQTERGIGIIRRLNNFSHSCDENTSELDIYEITAAITGLSQRLADMARVNLTTDRTNSESVIVHNNPLKIQQIIFLILREIFKAASKDDGAGLMTKKTDNGAIISIVHTFSGEPYAPELSIIGKIAEEIGGRVETVKAEKVLIYNITIT
ncbi:MAG: hypothetical protein ABIJ45_06705 [Candidatus Zixiibacteriota bacterium]